MDQHVETGAGSFFMAEMSSKRPTRRRAVEAGMPEAAVRDSLQRLPCREALEFALACDSNVVVSLHFEVDMRDSPQLRDARPRCGG